MVVTVSLDLSLVASLGIPSLQVWPPPGRQTWQYRLVWTLFLCATIGLLVVGGLDAGSLGLRRWIGEAGSLIAGTTLFGVGTAIASYAMGFLGRRAALGLEDELITEGPYTWSRNPGYVGDLTVLLGYTLLTDSRLAGLVALVGGLWFVLAPLAEEPWLDDLYGDAYRCYKTRHPRWLL
jgi:protein-S-isoprenylcysteine O-methyltransferase Ste14